MNLADWFKQQDALMRASKEFNRSAPLLRLKAWFHNDLLPKVKSLGWTR